jgi:hypothetical protein
MPETNFQWAVRTAREMKENGTLKIEQPSAPSPAPIKKKHRWFVYPEYGYWRWGSANKDYVEKIRTAYQWGIKNNKTKEETAKKFNTFESHLWQYAQNNKLPKLKAK